MKKVRLTVIGLVVLVALGIAALAASPLHTRAAPPSRTVTSFTNIPISGKTPSGGTFNGTLTVTSFAQQNSKLVAQGTLSGTLTDKAGNVIGTVTNQPVTLPARIIDPPSCSILRLVLGPINLNLLGLMVHVSQITVTITAQPGTLLGGLLCQLASTTILQQIVNLLNQILAALGG